MKKQYFIIFVLGVVLLASVYLLNLNKSTDPAEIPSDIPEVEEEGVEEIEVEFVAFAMLSNKAIVGFTSDNQAITLLDISRYANVQYTYYENKLYVYLSEQATGASPASVTHSLGVIDLAEDAEGHYNYLRLTDTNVVGWSMNIAALAGNIYIPSATWAELYKYSLASASLSKVDSLVDTPVLPLLFSSKNYLIYQDNDNIGYFNPSNGRKEIIASNASVEYIYQNKLIYTKFLTPSSYFDWTYYEYDLTTETTKPISEETTHFQTKLYYSYIVPVKNYFVYVERKSLYKYDHGRSKLFEFNQNIESLTLIGNKLIASYDLCVLGPCTTPNGYYEFNLDTLTATEVISDDFYWHVIYPIK